MQVQAVVREQFYHGKPDEFNEPDNERDVQARPIYLDPLKLGDMSPAAIELAVKKVLTSRGLVWRERVSGSSTIVRRLVDWEVK